MTLPRQLCVSSDPYSGARTIVRCAVCVSLATQHAPGRWRCTDGLTQHGSEQQRRVSGHVQLKAAAHAPCVDCLLPGKCMLLSLKLEAVLDPACKQADISAIHAGGMSGIQRRSEPPRRSVHVDRCTLVRLKTDGHQTSLHLGKLSRSLSASHQGMHLLTANSFT